MIEIINHLGHCLGYNTIEASETDLATKISEKGEALSNGLTPSPALGTALAWDNYS